MGVSVPKFLVSAGDPVHFRTFALRAGDVVDMPAGLLETFSATNQARFSSSAAAATVSIPAFYAPASASAAGGGRGWAADAPDLTLDDVYDISADGGADAFTSIAIGDGKVTAEIAANGQSGLRIGTYAALEDFEIVILLNMGIADMMSDASQNMSIALVCALLADTVGGVYNPANDDWKGGAIRIPTSTTSMAIGFATRTNDGDAWDGAESNFGQGTTYYDPGPFGLCLRRSGAQLESHLIDSEGALIHELNVDPAWGDGPCRVIIRGDNGDASTGRRLFVHAIRTDLTAVNGLLVPA